jgi:hypothetical protein
LSYGRAGVAFTIAAIILISGIYLRLSFSSPTLETSFYDDSYLYYKDLQTQTFGVAPGSTIVKSFEGEKGQKVSLTLNFDDGSPVSQSQSTSIIRTIINVTDSGGKQLVYDNNVGRSYSIQPIQIMNNGTVAIAVTNQEERPLSVTMYLRQSGQPPSAFTGINDSIVTFSNWLMTISAPIFGLGAWLLVSESRKKGAVEQPKSNPT